MTEIRSHIAKQVSLSNRGLLIEFYSDIEAQEFYRDGTSRGITYIIENNVVIKPKIKPVL
ncbi:MAG: hypothetical protein ACRDBG_04560 [Waterburya sp.]